jgi:hypothetical protein
MAIRHEHEIHTRRFGRNLGLGLVLGALALLIFGLSVVKISHLEEGKLPAAESTQ